MRKVVTSDELKLEKPEAVTSTRLRKYVATVSQILDLQENELDWLARHLSHDISVHREYYRLHESTIELAKVGKILTTVDEGKTRLWAGKSLDDIDLDKDIDPISDRDSESDEDSNAGMEPHSSRRKQKGRQRSGKSRIAHETSVPRDNDDHQVSRDSGSEECIVTDAAKHTPHQQVSRQQQSVSSRKLQGTPAPKQNAMTEKTKKATRKENVAKSIGKIITRGKKPTKRPLQKNSIYNDALLHRNYNKPRFSKENLTVPKYNTLHNSSSVKSIN
ncbi:uncharacterized protein [Montipora foliosa]|uniref:uncharacterized protein n=1 Tax=Montipora foliosa TaxID=591990 RepID=UPI0035F20D05